VADEYKAGKLTTTPLAQFGHWDSVAPDPPLAPLRWYFFYIGSEIGDF
jgi:hypothetical protein